MTHSGTRRRATIALDVICVHSYLGFTRFERAASQVRKAGVALTVTVRPYQVVADAPLAGEPLIDRHRRDFGPDAEEIVAPMKQIAAREGLEFVFERAIFANTFRAHLLLQRANRAGLAEPMAERLFRAYFTDGLNVADVDVLTDLAAEVGLVPDPGLKAALRVSPEPGPDDTEEARALREELASTRSDGITSVPTVRLDRGETLVGAASVERYAALLGVEVADPG